jgi:hypothetical protein
MARAAKIVMPRQTEKEFQAAVLELAHLRQWRSYHTWISIHSTGGFPDLVLVRRPRLLFVELKREGKLPTEKQQAWLDELRACGQDARLWTPTDWDEIREALL